MALTQDQRTALHCARQIIAEGRRIHLCLALNSVSMTYPKLGKAALLLKVHVMNAIAPFGTLDDWIMHHEQLKPEHARRIPWTKFERREARINWIDWMLYKPKEA
ncbi:hypothetical protein [Burkholderia sp. AU6039]|uniref:hypothetical protein n=1 Tax=Burkholderia sp. AU6039 TaxID=2015344 RepID=UPI000B7AB45B|nr:hypothetical protein [Burkholderia sp. AU6039]OXJ20285.1 hypothetical protein CFB39_10120 [Burkholderia sp. AU6039]